MTTKPKKEGVVWHWADNHDATRSALHCYRPAQRYSTIGYYIGEKHEGNAALCNKRYGISEDGDSFLHIEAIEPNDLDRNAACKRCLKIYDSLKD